MRKKLLMFLIFILSLSTLIGCSKENGVESSSTKSIEDYDELNKDEDNIKLEVRGYIVKLELNKSRENYFYLTFKDYAKENGGSFSIKESILKDYKLKVGDFIEGVIEGNIENLDFKEFKKIEYKVLEGLVKDVKLKTDKASITLSLINEVDKTLNISVNDNTNYENTILETIKTGDLIRVLGVVDQSKMNCEKVVMMEPLENKY